MMKSIAYAIMLTIIPAIAAPAADEVEGKKQLLSPVETAEQAVQLALIYTGFDDSDELTMLRPDEMAVQTVMRGSSMPFLADSVNGKPVWIVRFEDVSLDVSELTPAVPHSVDIELLEAFISQRTGQLLEVRVSFSDSRPFPEKVLDVFDDELHWLSQDETYHGFCKQFPVVPLKRLFLNKRSSFIGAQLLIARCVVESHKLRDRKLPGPAWVVSALYHGTHESAPDEMADQEGGFTVKHVVVDATTGDVLLRYDWWDSADNLDRNYKGPDSEGH